MIRGRVPEPDSRRRDLAIPITYVVDTPYRGRRPRLPRSLPRKTRKWWDRVSRLPHCATWDAAMWQFAVASTQVHAGFIESGHYATELRRREAELGVSASARARLRIRYIKEGERSEQ